MKYWSLNLCYLHVLYLLLLLLGKGKAYLSGNFPFRALPYQGRQSPPCTFTSKQDKSSLPLLFEQRARSRIEATVLSPSEEYQNRKGKSRSRYTLNKAITSCETVEDILDVLGKVPDGLSSIAGGGQFREINYATSVHRLAKYAGRSRQGSSRLLSDPRFALLVACLGETLVAGRPSSRFMVSTRYSVYSIENIMWSLAKLRLVSSRGANEEPLTRYQSKIILEKTCSDIRILAGSRKQQDMGYDRRVKHLVEIACTAIVDILACEIVASRRADFNTKSIARIFWAHAFSKCFDEELLDHLTGIFITQWRLKTPSAQEISLAAWSLASLGAAGEGKALTRHLAISIRCDATKSFFHAWLPQELAMIAWSVATLRQKSQNNNMGTAAMPMETCITILEAISDELKRRLDHSGSAASEGLSNLRSSSNLQAVQSQQFKPLDVSNILWSYATLHVYDGNLSGLLTALLIERSLDGDLVQPQDWANTLWALASSIENDVGLALVEHLALHIHRHPNDLFFEGFSPQGVSNTLWSVARICRDSCRTDSVRIILEAATKEIMRRHDGDDGGQTVATQFNAHDVCNILGAFATAKISSPKVIGLLTHVLIGQSYSSREITSRDWSNSIWALATLEDTEAGMAWMDRVSAMIESDQDSRFFEGSIPQCLSNTVWSLATLTLRWKEQGDFSSDVEKSCSNILDAACKVILGRFDVEGETAFSSQQLANIAWAYSAMGLRRPYLIQVITESMVADPTLHCKADDQAFANVIWAFAKQVRLCEAPQENIDNGEGVNTNPPPLALALKLIDVAAEQCDGLQAMSMQGMAQFCWAMAVIRVRHEPFLELVQEAIHHRLNTMERSKEAAVERHGLCHILWAFATLNIDRGFQLNQTISCIASALSNETTMVGSVLDSSGVFTGQELANLAWSLAVLKHYDRARLFVGLLRYDTLYEVLASEHFNELQIQRVLAAEVAMALEAPEAHRRALEKICDVEHLKEFRENVYGLDQLAQFVTVSYMQKNVSQAMARIGFEHELEHSISMADFVEARGIDIPPLDNRNVFSIDIACPHRKIGVEVDGPHHFVRVVRNIGEVRSKKYASLEQGGSTAFKKRLMEQIGWKIVNVPYWEWRALKGDPDAEDEYCRLLLGRSGSDPEISSDPK